MCNFHYILRRMVYLPPKTWRHLDEPPFQEKMTNNYEKGTYIIGAER